MHNTTSLTHQGNIVMSINQKQIFKRSNAFFYIKQGKGNPKTQSIVQVSLYDDCGLLHLSIIELPDNDSSDCQNDIYESTSCKAELIDLTYSMLDFRTCDIQTEQDDKSNQTLHYIRLATGLFTWKKPTIQLAFNEFSEASSWHSHLLMVIKSGAKTMAYKQSIGYEAEDGPAKQTTNCIRKETNDFQLEAFMSEWELEQESAMIRNDVYESTCPPDVFQAVVIKTEKSESLGLIGEYWLKVDGDTLYLMEAKSRSVIQDWPIKSIRKFGLRRECLLLEAGNACCGGPGKYVFKLMKSEEFMSYFMDAKNKLQTSSKTSGINASSPIKTTINKPPAPPSKPPLQLAIPITKAKGNLPSKPKHMVYNEYDNPVVPCNLDKGVADTKEDSPPPVYVTAQAKPLNVAQISEALNKQIIANRLSDVNKKFKFNS